MGEPGPPATGSGAGAETTSGDAPLDVVRRIYQHMAAGDFGSLFELLHDDVVVTQDPALPWGGRHVGHDGFAAFGLTLTGAIESAVTIEAIFAADDEVIQVGRTRGHVRATGVAFDVPEVHRWTIVDGRARSAHFAIDTAAMLGALGDTAPG